MYSISTSHVFLLGLGGLDGKIVLGAAVHETKMLHATSAGCVASAALAAPVVHALAGRRVATRRANTLLNVVRRLAATHTQRVRLVVALSERLSTLRLLEG